MKILGLVWIFKWQTWSGAHLHSISTDNWDQKQSDTDDDYIVYVCLPLSRCQILIAFQTVNQVWKKGTKNQECFPKPQHCYLGTFQLSLSILQPYKIGFTNFKDEKFNVTMSNSAVLWTGANPMHIFTRAASMHINPELSSLCLHNQRVFNAIHEQEKVQLRHYRVLLMMSNIWHSCTLLLRV